MVVWPWRRLIHVRASIFLWKELGEIILRFEENLTVITLRLSLGSLCIITTAHHHHAVIIGVEHDQGGNPHSFICTRCWSSPWRVTVLATQIFSVLLFQLACKFLPIWFMQARTSLLRCISFLQRHLIAFPLHSRNIPLQFYFYCHNVAETPAEIYGRNMVSISSRIERGATMSIFKISIIARGDSRPWGTLLRPYRILPGFSYVVKVLVLKRFR